MLLEELSNIADNLAAMPDVALPRFAQMHKSDPYIMALVVSESNRRKAARVAKAPQVQPELTIADEEIAEMSGIAALPAENMEMMSAAAGGIIGDMNDGYDMAVGYADGGMVERYQAGGTSGRSQFLQDLAAIPDLYEQWWLANREKDRAKLAAETQRAADRTARTEAQGKASLFNYLFGTPEREAEGKAELAQLAAKSAGAGQSTAGAVPPVEGMIDPTTGRALAQAAPAGASTPRPAAPATAAPAADKTPAAPRPAAPLGVKELFESLSSKTSPTDPFEDRRKELAAAEAKAAKEASAEFEKEVEARGKAFADREARLKARQEKLEGREKELSSSSLVEAGLAILAGESPNALQNIGRGLQVGTKAYRQGLKDIEDGREKLDDAFSRIEEFRRNEDMLTAKERRQFKKDIRTAETAGLKSLLDGAEKAYGMSREDAKTMFTGAIQQQVAQIGASATLGAARIRASENRAWMEDVRSAQAVETARKNLKDQITKAMPYATEQEREAAFKRQWPEVLRMNPNLAQYAGAPGGGGAPTGGAADFVFNPATGKVEPRK